MITRIPHSLEVNYSYVSVKVHIYERNCTILKTRKFGYVRASAKDQNENRQIEAMKEIGIDDRDIFVDKQLGKNFERENYQLMKRMMRKGDTLYIHSLDRFGRNKEYIISDLILQVLSWIAEDERERILKRQREGIDSALANGLKFGRPSIQVTDEFIQAYGKWKTGKITAVRAMDEAGMKKSSFYKMVKKYETSVNI